MITGVAAILVLLGTVLSALAAVGVVRMPDFYSRLQASTKASTLGVGCLVVAAALQIDDSGTSAQVLLVGAFLMLTTPISAHMISRAAYAEGVPLWHGVVVDELQAGNFEAFKGGKRCQTNDVPEQPPQTEPRETPDGRENTDPASI